MCRTLRDVNHFLLVFDRAHGRLLREQSFQDHRQALIERFRAERMQRDNPDIEVVVLSAQSREALRLTHSRYFQSISDLGSVSASARTAAKRVAAKAAAE